MLDTSIYINPTSDIIFEPFRPALQERFLARFHQAAKMLAMASSQERELIIQTEVEWAETTGGNPRQQTMYQAVWLLLRDLLRVGWTPGWNDATATFEIGQPPANIKSHSQEETHAHKEARRAMMAHERHTKLYDARDFILRMESPTRGLPIGALIADGRQIASELAGIARIVDDQERHTALQGAICPYLQLVEENVRCSFTGHLLGDIWRYFRLTWSTPSYNTPGRSLFYLVRDAAHPNHPVMGIASLENAPIFIGVRDAYLGWTTESFIDSLLKEDLEGPNPVEELASKARQAFERLLSKIRTAVREINADGLCTSIELANPTPELLKRLSGFAVQFAEERREALREWASYQDLRSAGDVDEELQRSAYGNISEEAYRLLFQKKRAGELARILGAQMGIEQLLARADFAQEWQRWASTEKGSMTIRNGLVTIKNHHVGTSILELNVCGAIPPYNHLLAGKLTALLICSPQVARDYRNRYGNARSEIASQMKGEDVSRPAELVYIGTTSLYTAGASQYNRLKLPAGLLRPGAPTVEFKLLGETLGYGTSHISEATTSTLEEAAKSDYLQVNHVMGEGVSPKMRIIRQGLNAIFREGQRTLSDMMARHQMQRLVYGVWLAENGRAYLQGQAEKPNYIWDSMADPVDGTAQIADFWRTRWLDSRLKHSPSLTAMSSFQPLSMLLSAEFDEKPDVDWAYTRSKGKRNRTPSIENGLGTANNQDVGEQQRQLVRDLYRGTSGMAENIPIDDLRHLHAPSALDTAIRQHIAAGRSVVLTGNPGDGKTHLLLMLISEIKAMNAVVEPDASQVRNDQIVEHWRQAQAANRPYFIAINESVLFKLASTYPDFTPLRNAWEQVSKAVVYRSIADAGTVPSLPIGSQDDVIVLDLSHRNTLDSALVDAVIIKLTETIMLPRCSLCPASGCDLVRNQALVRSERVRKRLHRLFEYITRRGIHVTMRDLQGFIAYLLFANRNCSELLKQSDETKHALPQLPFTGEGKLFNAARQTFDPARVCHPIYDDHIINNTLRAEDWLYPEMAYGGSLDAAVLERFEQRKRAFYFFHDKGEALLKLASDEDIAFANFLAETNPRTALRNILAKLNAFFSRSSDRDRLPVWQSHRYDHSAQRILYAVQWRERTDFELLRPVLTPHMSEAFKLADDHRLLRLGSNPQVSLRIDFDLFQLLYSAERGLPVLFLQPDLARRIWKFLEQLPNRNPIAKSEVTAQILDSVTGELTIVTVDVETSSYISISKG